MSSAHTHPASPGLLLQVLAEADEQPRPVDTAPGCHLVAFPLGVSREACGAGLWAQKAPRDHIAHRRRSRAPVLTFHGIQPAHVASSLSLDLLSLPCADGRLLEVRGALPHLSSQASWRGAGHTAGAPERGLRAQNLKNFKAALPSAGVGGGPPRGETAAVTSPVRVSQPVSEGEFAAPVLDFAHHTSGERVGKSVPVSALTARPFSHAGPARGA